MKSDVGPERDWYLKSKGTEEDVEFGLPVAELGWPRKYAMECSVRGRRAPLYGVQQMQRFDYLMIR
jgi:hypothetical protein